MKIIFYFFVLLCYNLHAQKTNDSIANFDNYFIHGDKVRSKTLDINPEIRVLTFADGNLDSVINNNLKALKLCETFNDKYFTPTIYLNLISSYKNKQEYTLAKFYVNKGITLAKKNDFKSWLVVYETELGNIYQKENNFNKSVAHYKKALHYAKKPFYIINIKMALAALYINSNNSDDKKEAYTIAREYLNEILALQKKIANDLTPKEKSHLDIYLIYTYEYLATVAENFQEKIKNLNKGLAIAQNKNNPRYIAYIYRSFSRNFLGKGKYNEAERFLKKLIIISNQNNYIDYLSNAYSWMAQIKEKKGDYKAAIIYGDSLKTYNKNKISLETEAALFNAYYHLEDYYSSSTIAKGLIKRLDSLVSTSKEQVYIDYGKKYQTDKKIQENELLKKENQIKALEVSKQKKARNFLILLSVLGLITLSVTYNRFRAKKKMAKVLEEQNTIITNQKFELEKSNANKQRLFGIIAHDLVNPFNAILGYTQLLENDYESFKDKERKKFISTINKYANNNYKLTRTLLDWAKLQQERLIVNKTKLECKEIVTEALKPYQVLADKKEITVTTNIAENCYVEADKNMMQIVIGNLFVNAIKFTPQKGEVILNLNKNSDGTVTIEIKDNGLGMTQEHLNNLFDITKVKILKGTNNEQGHGLGLILCKELMELQKGTIQMFSQVNKGSTVVLSI